MRALAIRVVVYLVSGAVACSGGEANPPPVTTATSQATAASTAPPPPSSPAAEAPAATQRAPVMPHPGTLQAVPATGSCDDVFLLTASGFAPREMVEFHLFAGLNETLVAGSPFANETGEAVLPISLGSLAGDGCFPGSERVFEARSAGATARIAWPRATFAVEQIGRFWIEPDHGPCGTVEATAHGESLPPGTSLRLRWGQNDPMAHNFAELTTVEAGDDGSFETAIVFQVPCDGPAIAIYGSSYDGLTAARWKAIYTVDSP